MLSTQNHEIWIPFGINTSPCIVNRCSLFRWNITGVSFASWIWVRGKQLAHSIGGLWSRVRTMELYNFQYINAALHFMVFLQKFKILYASLCLSFWVSRYVKYHLANIRAAIKLNFPSFITFVFKSLIPENGSK